MAEELLNMGPAAALKNRQLKDTRSHCPECGELALGWKYDQHGGTVWMCLRRHTWTTEWYIDRGPWPEQGVM